MCCAVYQKRPEAKTAVAWKVSNLPPQKPAITTITLSYGIAIIKWNEESRKWIIKKSRNVQLGGMYQVSGSATEPVIDAHPIESPDITVPGDQVSIRNNTHAVLDLGFTADGDLLATTTADGGVIADFHTQTGFSIAVYDSIIKGQLVDGGAKLGPVELEFTDGFTSAEVEITNYAGKLILKKPKLVV